MKTDHNLWSFPGRVLVIDDNFNDVEKFVLELAKKGISVEYWDGKSVRQSPLLNIRVIILDLDLTGGIISRGEPSYYSLAAQALHEVKGPYLLIIYSADFVDDDIAGLKAIYEEQFASKISGFVISKGGATKETSFEELYQMIETATENKKIFKLILTWEKLLDSAKDEGLGKFASEQVENEFHAFVQSVANDVVSLESLPREFISNMMRMLTRYMNKGSNFQELSKILEDLVSSGQPTTSDPILLNLRMYFVPDKSEKPWTGDIYRIEVGNPYDGKNFWQYGIVLTPVCDLVQNKAERLLLCMGIPISFESLKDSQHPFYKLNKSFKWQYGKDGKPDENKQEINFNKAVKDAMKNLPLRIYPLWHFKDGSNYFGLCFDFQNVCSIELNEINSENRICRLDSPIVEDMLQRYGSYAFRIGAPDSNSPT